jgi:Trypsin-co-occurring domain 2
VPRSRAGTYDAVATFGEVRRVFDDKNSIGLAGALQALRADIAVAQEEAKAAGLTFPVTSVTVELKATVSRQVDGKAGFRIPLVNAELGGQGGWKSEMLQTITVVLGSPATGDGVPVRVRLSDSAEKN